MQFANIAALQFIWILILVIFLLRILVRRKKRITNEVIATHLHKKVIADIDERRARHKSIIMISVAMLSILALARPQWGFQWQEVKQQGLDLMIVVDTSKSMLTQDIKPNRLERTKLAVKDVLGSLAGDRVGLVAFAGEAFLVCPLTVDYNGFLMSLRDLNENSIPRGGTDIASAIRVALKSFDSTPSEHKAIIIITDGDNLEGNPLEMAEKAKRENVKVYTIGIGTTEGDLIQIENVMGEREFLKDDKGNFIKSRLNEAILKSVALKTDGAYVRSTGAEFGLELLYKQYLSKMQQREFEVQKQKRYFERFQFPLALACLLLILDTVLGRRKKEK